MGEISAKIKEFEQNLDPLEDELNGLLLKLPNPPAADVPEGKSDEENVVIREWGEIPQFDFEPKDHLELGEALDLVDMTRAAKLAGSRTYLLKNDGALLELAVLQFALQYVLDKGFSPLIVPTLVNRSAMEGTGYFPGGEQIVIAPAHQLAPVVKSGVVREERLAYLAVFSALLGRFLDVNRRGPAKRER